jgi:hypothetical protein
VVRHINAQRIGYSLAGLGVGIAVGFFIGYRWNRSKIRAEAFRESEEEVEKIREMYRDNAKIRIDEKPDLDAVVEERQYSILSEEEVERTERLTRPPVPVEEPRRDPRVPPGPVIEPPPDVVIKLDTSKSKNVGWEFEEELATRSEDRPYIIHQDEYQGNETGYKQEVLTWYAGDEVLTDEDEEPMDNADEIVDLNHMSRFGHGTDDFNVIFVRNDRLRMEYEICRSPDGCTKQNSAVSLHTTIIV